MTVSPNPRLQRTRFALLRSPVSRKPLGVTGQERAGQPLVCLAETHTRIEQEVFP